MRGDIHRRIAYADDPTGHGISWEGRLGMTQEIARPDECELEVAAFFAARNWEDWRCCFEDPPEKLAIYEDRELFGKFVKEYRLLRGERSQNREKLQGWMTRNGRVNKLIDKEDGSGVESLLEEMKRDKFMGHRSFLSKIAAFSRPEVFIAHDSYASKGLVNLGVVPRAPGDYVTYLEAVRKLKCAILPDMEEHLEGRNIPTENETAFHLRVLDVHLMMSGGRRMKTTSEELFHSLKRSPSECRLF